MTRRVSVKEDTSTILMTDHRNIGEAFFFEQGGCLPSSTSSKAECASLNNNCGKNLKWTGKGCRSKKGKSLGDGGCQCKGYCGYSCPGACKSDKECIWSTKKKACYVRATGLPGGPITSC